jgi:hypothetical protein
VLTPHRLGPATADGPFPDGHLLHAGVYNLGFCAVDRRAGDFLDWWWGHLRTECLYDPGAGLYLDQRWVDVGSVYFNASALRHYGYNASLTNLPERRVVRDADGYYIDGTEDRLRLFHFHSFDPRRPKELSIRFSTLQPEGFRTSDLSGGSEALISLCEHYATAVLEKERELGPQPPYIYESDTTGRPITPRTRRVYGVAALADPGGVPSPFIPAEDAEYEQWRRASRPLTGRLMLSDVAKGFRSALPQEYQNLKRRFPRLTASLRGRFIKKRGMW